MLIGGAVKISFGLIYVIYMYYTGICYFLSVFLTLFIKILYVIVVLKNTPIAYKRLNFTNTYLRAYSRVMKGTLRLVININI